MEGHRDESNDVVSRNSHCSRGLEMGLQIARKRESLASVQSADPQRHEEIPVASGKCQWQGWGVGRAFHVWEQHEPRCGSEK